MKKTYNKKSKEEKEKEVNSLLEKANEGIEKCFNTPEDFKELAKYISRFYNYSLRNTLLIQQQFKGALAVGSYAFWKEKGFTVNKGEKGIKILVPTRLSDYFINSKGEEVKISKASEEEKQLIKQGKLEVRQGKLVFNQGYVFEISQTNAKAEDLPKIFPNKWLEGDVKDYDLMYKAMENIAKSIGVRIVEPKRELGVAKGVSYPLTKEVALNPRNTQLQNVKTLIHELAHAKLHTVDNKDNYLKHEKEFQAELTAYTVCKYFNIDTEEYSFRYINEWIKDSEIKDREKLINEVRETVKEYIDVIEDTLTNNKNSKKANKVDNEITIEDKELKEFLGKDRVFIKEITKEEFEKKIEENKSYKFLENCKDLSFKNYILATKENDTYKDLYVNKEYKGENLIYIDDNKELYRIMKNKNMYDIREEDFMKIRFGLDEKDKENINIKENGYYSNDSLKNKFLKELEKYNTTNENSSIKADNRSDYYDSTFDIDKINEYIKEKGFEKAIESMVSAYLYTGVVDPEYGEFTYNDIVLRNKEIVKDSVIKLAEIEFNKESRDMMPAEREKEIRKKIREHEEWISSKGARGKQLNLENENLKGMKLLNLDLRNSNFKNADISDCIIFADLRGADLTGAKINNTKWVGSNINKMTIEANKLNLIEYQLEQEGLKHTSAMKSLKTNNKEKELER